MPVQPGTEVEHRQIGLGVKEATDRDLTKRITRDLPQLTETEVAQLACVVDRLIDAYEPRRIYLFGSKARGDSSQDSDFDLMVIVRNSDTSERKSSRLAYQRLWGTGTAADVLVWTEDRFDSRLHLRASLPATILREGRLLYAA